MTQVLQVRNTHQDPLTPRVIPAARFGLTSDTTIWGWLAPTPCRLREPPPALFIFNWLLLISISVLKSSVAPSFRRKSAHMLLTRGWLFSFSDGCFPDS